MITVYTKPACVQCDATKRHLDKAGMEYDTIDISKNPDALDEILNLGFMAAPVVITDNDSWSGFQPDKLDGLAN